MATSFNLQPRELDLADLLLDRCNFKDCVISANRSDNGYLRPNLFILPSTDTLAEAKSELMIKMMPWITC